ncbi:MAG TPA: ribosome maturation factor RimP [Longimicrobiales bacterium]
MTDELERQIEERVAGLGYELVELERAGSKTRPILRVRVDVPGSEPGSGVSVEDCARVSRALEEYLDESPDLAERYVLEVSSPGVERPLVRTADFTRFAGREIAVKLSKPLASGARRVEGELVGLESGDGGDERIRLRLPDGSMTDIPRADVTRANLIFRWGDRR